HPEFEGDDINWHLIGQLQKNKVRHIIDKVCLIHSVDSFDLALEINKRAAAIGKIQDILIQVNISGEESKSGAIPDDVPLLCEKISELENVRIKGLMTISVRDFSYEQNYELFSQLRALAQDIKNMGIKNVDMQELSMGMTHDYEAAIAAGATIIRVGTAIFGERVNY
ncbi:MAG: YggS family pyridoxal phosphate-dependent enzyme, partial [Clostridia bacterium]|nr:YggS family pyridoxal phosphate-dependent enzyme [Clostridia bacterium]